MRCAIDFINHDLDNELATLCLCWLVDI